MRIGNIISGLHDPTTLAKRAETNEAGLRGTAPAGDAAGAAAAASALSEILGQYDVSHITPNEYSTMIQQLRGRGVISDREFDELHQIRADLDKSGVDPTERLNLVEFCEERVDDAERARDGADAATKPAAESILKLMQRRLDWAQKFAALQEDPAAIGLSALA